MPWEVLTRKMFHETEASKTLAQLRRQYQCGGSKGKDDDYTDPGRNAGKIERDKKQQVR